VPVYRVELKPSAIRQLARDRRRIAGKIDSLARHPRPRGVEKLKGADDLWRVHVGNLRVI
jgi:mRNA-degrading endonuclease RelE of RelBE toxin-antitoxin system